MISDCESPYLESMDFLNKGQVYLFICLFTFCCKQMLGQLNATLEEENKALVEQVNKLVEQVNI